MWLQSSVRRGRREVCNLKRGVFRLKKIFVALATSCDDILLAPGFSNSGFQASTPRNHRQ